MQLLKYLDLSESDFIWVSVGDSNCHEVLWKKGRARIAGIKIPCRDPRARKDPTLRAEQSKGFGYPNSGESRATRRIYARNLRALLLDIEAIDRRFEEAGVRAGAKIDHVAPR